MSSLRSNFSDRHIGPDAKQVQFMLDELSEKDLEVFIAKVVPANIALAQKISTVLPEAISEVDALAELRGLASENRVIKSLIGLGYYGTITPPVILRNVLESAAWYLSLIHI